MKGFYKRPEEYEIDLIMANSIRVCSVGLNGEFVPASSLEKHLHEDEKAAAVARLAIYRVMSETE